MPGSHSKETEAMVRMEQVSALPSVSLRAGGPEVKGAVAALARAGGPAAGPIRAAP
jgi:hypothetical protein